MKKIILLFLGLQLFWVKASYSLTIGDKLPELTAINQDGKSITLTQSLGQFVLIYFYPKDETPGCTTEAQKLRDLYPEMKKNNIIVYGVSKQDQKSHKAFHSKFSLPFDLLVDQDGKMAKEMGVGLIPLMGWTKRKSLLFNPDGKLIKFYDDVNPELHAQEVLKDVLATTLNQPKTSNEKVEQKKK
jgi:peroxiredoxin Q/BCP